MADWRVPGMVPCPAEKHESVHANWHGCLLAINQIYLGRLFACPRELSLLVHGDINKPVHVDAPPATV